jgi:hypothetical protein
MLCSAGTNVFALCIESDMAPLRIDFAPTLWQYGRDGPARVGRGTLTRMKASLYELSLGL